MLDGRVLGLWWLVGYDRVLYGLLRSCFGAWVIRSVHWQAAAVVYEYCLAAFFVTFSVLNWRAQQMAQTNVTFYWGR